MTRAKELLRKLAATTVAVVLMSAMIIFAFKMLLSVPIFDPMLQTILLVCTGILSVATLLFLYAKVAEMVAILKEHHNGKHPHKASPSQSGEAAPSCAHGPVQEMPEQASVAKQAKAKTADKKAKQTVNSK